MQIPYYELSEDTLRNLVQEFVLREATDYGVDEVPLESKINQVISQLKSGKVTIVYDEYLKSCSIITKG